MITTEEAIRIHSLLIENFGGTKGVRDIMLLEAALSRPYASFGDDDLYPGISEKAAALIESVIVNHPFLDGNKRVGYVLMKIMLEREKRDIDASEDEKYDFVLSVAKGELSTEEIKNWIEKRIIDK